MRHPIKVLVVFMVALLVLTACQPIAAPAPAAPAAPAQSAAAQPAAPAAPKLSFCVVHNNADHPSIAAIVNGMNDEAPLYGAKVTYFDPAFDPQKQASQIEDCIAQKPNVILVNAVDPTAVIASLKKANDAGIPVIMHNADTTAEGHQYTKAYVGSQSFDQGYAVGQMMAKQLDGKGKVVVIIGKPGQTDVVNRTAGLKQAWADAKANFEVLAEQPAEWSKDKALSVMQDMLTRYPQIDAVFALDDPMALGALEAIKAAGRQGIKVYGVNGNKEACQAVKNGDMSGTALQLSYLVGVYSMRAAYDLTKGRIIPDKILAPTAPVTKDNVDQWMAQCW
jgi:ABC-type sugar transport system substrate-binding protein